MFSFKNSLFVSSVGKLISTVLMLSAWVNDASAQPGVSSEVLRRLSPSNALTYSPVSPELASLNRYGAGQQNLFNGRVGVQIPLYEYSDNDFTLPVVLSYSTDGFRPGADHGVVGMGWNLICGGAVTREVRGLPDDVRGVTRHWKWAGNIAKENEGNISSSIAPQARLESNMLDSRGDVNLDGYGVLWSMEASEYERIADRLDYYYDGALESEYNLFRPYVQSDNGTVPVYGAETESDIYHFNFCGMHGDFILGLNSGIHVYNSNIPSSCVRVEWDFDAANPHVSVFRISPGDGYEYVFAQMESAQSYDVMSNNDGSAVNTAWRLSRIVAPNGQEMIFHYNVGPQTFTSYKPFLIEDRMQLTDSEGNVYRMWLYGNEGSDPSWIARRTGVLVNRVSAARLDSVTVSGRVNISFDYDNYGMLSEIAVTNVNSYPVRNIKLAYAACGRMLLRKLSIHGEGDYCFSYWDENATFPEYTTCMIDNMGFYNGSDSYVNLPVPLYKNGFELESYANDINLSRVSSFEFSRMGSLRSVIWPGGGRTEFEYGLNKVLRDGIEEDYYGIRLSEVKNYDTHDSLVQRRWYEYVDSTGRCSGRQTHFPQIYHRYSIESDGYSIKRESVNTLTSAGLGPQSEIEYSCVREHICKGTDSEAITEYYFRTSSSTPDEVSEYYQSAENDVIYGNADWSYELSESYVPHNLERAGETYGSGSLLAICERDPVSGECLKRKSYDYQTAEVNVDLSFPSMFGNRLCHHVVRPEHLYLSLECNKEKMSNGTKTEYLEYSVDELCRPESVCEWSDDSSERRTVMKHYLPECPLLENGESTYLARRLVKESRIDYVAQNASDSSNSNRSYYRPSAYYSRDMKSGIWKLQHSILSYDAYGNPTCVQDALGNKIYWEWDDYGHYPFRRKSINGNQVLIWQWEWEPLVGLRRELRPSGMESMWRYDTAGRLVEQKVNDNLLFQAVYNR